MTWFVSVRAIISNEKRACSDWSSRARYCNETILNYLLYYREEVCLSRRCTLLLLSIFPPRHVSSLCPLVLRTDAAMLEKVPLWSSFCAYKKIGSVSSANSQWLAIQYAGGRVKVPDLWVIEHLVIQLTFRCRLPTAAILKCQELTFILWRNLYETATTPLRVLQQRSRPYSIWYNHHGTIEKTIQSTKRLPVHLVKSLLDIWRSH